MTRLSWITDAALESAVERLQQRTRAAVAKAAQRQRQNVTDPFLSLVIAESLGLREQADLEQRQAVQSATQAISMALGDFHQRVLGSVDGWDNHDAGYDLECPARRILAEVKNKHNTMNAGTREGVEDGLDHFVQGKGQGWTGYLVLVIAKRKRRYRKRLQTRRTVYETDGGSFYELVTGRPDAMHDLFQVLTRMLAPSSEIAAYCADVYARGIPPTEARLAK